MSTSRGPALLAVLSCLAVLLTGCTKTIKKSDLDSKISENLKGQLATRQITVDCPSGKEAKKGATFTCRAKIGTQDATIDVRLVDDSGKFSFRVRPAT